MSDSTPSAVHNQDFRFRASGSLLAAARETARREGMTLSELVRHALRRQLREIS